MWLMEMRRRNLALIAYGIGLFGQVLLPLGFKFFAFIIPAILFCICLRLEDPQTHTQDNFNLWLFILILFPFIFIPSTFFNFDANNPFDGDQIFTGTYALASIATGIFFVGIPTYLFGGAIYATALGKISQAFSAIVRGIVITGSLLILLFILTTLDMDPTGGMLDWVADLYLGLIMSSLNVPQAGYGVIQAGINGINGAIKGAGGVIENIADPSGALGIDMPTPQIPSLPSLPGSGGSSKKGSSGGIFGGLSFDAAQDEVKSGGYVGTMYLIHDALPIIISHLCLITALFMWKEEWEERIIEYLSRLFASKKPKERIIDHPGVNLTMLIYTAIILTFAFLIFVSYPRSYGQDPMKDWRYIGFFGIYLVMITFSVLVLNIAPKRIYYRDATVQNTVKGTIGGLIVLILLTRLFFTRQVMSAYSYLDIQNDAMYIAETFIFVAPAESLFFFVLWPGLVAGRLFQYNEKKRKTLFEATQREKIVVTEAKIETFTKMMEIAQNRGDKQLYEILQATINYLEKKKKREQLKEPRIIRQWKSLVGRRNTLILLIVFGVVLPAFAFATVHWPMINMTTGIDYITFWTCGLGIIYFSAATFFIFLSLRMGYQSGIQSHAVYNTYTIMLVILTLGV